MYRRKRRCPILHASRLLSGPLALAGVLLWAAQHPATATPPPGYYLVWGDEFNGTTLDTNKWDYWLLGTWNNAINTENAVSLNGSNLVITTYTSGGNNYTAMLATDQKFQPRYGYYEASIKWGDTNGMWSAFWLRSPTMGNWLTDPYVAGGELDVCEHRYVGIYETNYIANIVSDNIHWDGYGSAEQNAGSPNVGTNLQTGFHTYGLLWNGGSYDFSIDGTEVWNGTPAPLFGSDVYVILSSEVDDTSTTWAGYIPPGGYPSQAASNVKMAIDYFHYYAPTNVLFWTGASSAYWTNSANWISNLPPVAGSDLTFSYLSSNLNCLLGTNYSVDGLIYLYTLGAGSIGGTNTLTLGAGGIDMVSANHNVTINTPLALAANQRWTVGINNPGNLLTDNGGISGSATLTKAGYGTLVLSGSNSFSGVLNIDSGAVTNDGQVLITSSAAIAHVASINIRDPGIGVSALRLSNSVVVPALITLAGRNTNVVAIEAVAGSGNSLAGGLTLTGGGSNYLIQCDAGTLSLGGTISAGSGVSGPCQLTLQGNGGFAIPGSIQNGNASPLSVVKTNSGTLIIDGSLGGPLSDYGGTFAGTGSVAGDTTVQSGEVSPGPAVENSIGTLSFGANLTLGVRSLTLMEIDASDGTNDQLNVAGTLTYGGTLYVVILQGTPSPGQSFKLFKAGNITGGFVTLNLPSLPAGMEWDTNQLSAGVLSVDALPETLSITNLSSGQWQLNWVYGTLQSATNVGGPFSNILGATPPYAISATNGRQFYRLRIQ